ncbi:MAG: OmpA family protein [Candidatus Kapabacteria bacterium]|nr:OmpA family protein [Candidatus Kapabacteria bacterium]
MLTNLLHIKIVHAILILFILMATDIFSQSENQESDDKAREILEDARVQSARQEIEITVRSVDITTFPMIKIMIEAYNRLGEPLDTLTAENLFVFEKGRRRDILKVEKIPVAENVPVDFVFAVDITGSMQPIINSIKSNISFFTQTLVKRGIDYRLGLILFSDDIEKVYNPTSNVSDFLKWLNPVKARGGGDEKENALEALEAAAKMIDWREESNRVCVMITDAPYHQKGEDGHGVTDQTTSSIIEMMQKNDIRVFTIVPPKLTNYKVISSKTRGTFYDIDYPFSTILDNFSSQLTNLYYLTFESTEETIPDSIEIALFSSDSKQLIRKTIPIVELGRKLIIENLLFQTNRADLPEIVRELDILAEFMENKKNINILVEGHTDDIGSHHLNDKLSEARANSVRNYLIQKGISPKRIEIKGLGKRRPLATNDTEFGRRLNRRVEIVIIST